MSTTYANSINSNPIYAERAEKDAAGNTISTTYATKSELPSGVPAVTSSDDSKVLKATYSGGVGSYAWETESGAVTDVEVDGVSVVSQGVASITLPTVPVTDVTVNGTSVVSNGTAAVVVPAQVQSDWAESDTTSAAYIDNKPDLSVYATTSAMTSALADKQDTLTAGTNVSITNNVISATDTTYTAGANITISSGVISAASQVNADWSETDTSDPSYIENKPDLVDIVAGPGIVVDNPDGNTLRVSAETDAETVLWTGDTGQILIGTTGTCNLAESALNFDRLRLYARGSAQNINGETGAGIDIVEFSPMSNTAAYYPLNLAYSNDGTSLHNDTCVIQLSGSTLSYSKGSRFTLSTSGVSVNTSRGPAIVKIVGVHRIANN